MAVIVDANLGGDLASQAETIVRAMRAAQVRRLILVSSMRIHDEVPGERLGSILDPYGESAAIIEASCLAYTLIQAAWLNDTDEIAYGTRRKGDTFENAFATVSRMSVADLIVRLATTADNHVGESIGGHSI